MRVLIVLALIAFAQAVDVSKDWTADEPPTAELCTGTDTWHLDDVPFGSRMEKYGSANAAKNDGNLCTFEQGREAALTPTDCDGWQDPIKGRKIYWNDKLQELSGFDPKTSPDSMDDDSPAIFGISQAIETLCNTDADGSCSRANGGDPARHIAFAQGKTFWRLLMSNDGYSACANLHFCVCAAHNKIPKQKGILWAMKTKEAYSHQSKNAWHMMRRGTVGEICFFHKYCQNNPFDADPTKVYECNPKTTVPDDKLVTEGKKKKEGGTGGTKNLRRSVNLKANNMRNLNKNIRHVRTPLKKL